MALHCLILNSFNFQVCDIADKLITGKFDGTLAGLYFDNPSETPEADCRYAFR